MSLSRITTLVVHIRKVFDSLAMVLFQDQNWLSSAARGRLAGFLIDQWFWGLAACSLVDTNLRITEIFYSLQGESSTVGIPTVFVRLTGCPLRCGYCDSEYAFYGGEKISIHQIMEVVAEYGANYVCVTGGEPLAQPNCLPLLSALCDKGLQVSLETSGAMDIKNVDSRVCVVMDLKTPKSGEQAKNRYENIQFLKPSDQVKYVICDRRDYEWAKFKSDEYQLYDKVSEVLFSPCFGQVEAHVLAQWLLDDKLRARFQMQLHKVLWGDKPGV